MSYQPIVAIQPYSKGPFPTSSLGREVYYDNQLRDISIALQSLTKALNEVREYLQTLP